MSHCLLVMISLDLHTVSFASFNSLFIYVLVDIDKQSAQLCRRQFRMAWRFTSQNDGWPMRVSRWHPPATDSGAFRCRGHPVTRWDDRLNAFVRSKLGGLNWHEASQSLNNSRHEEAFVSFSG